MIESGPNLKRDAQKDLGYIKSLNIAVPEKNNRRGAVVPMAEYWINRAVEAERLLDKTLGCLNKRSQEQWLLQQEIIKILGGDQDEMGL